MIDKIKETLASVSTFEAKSKEEIESFRIKYLGKKGILNDFFAAFKEVPPQDKKAYGQALNELKNAVSDKVKNLQSEQKSTAAQHNYGDLSKPGFPINSGARHPLSLVKNRIVEIFSQIGFSISEGPEIEDDWHNFTALNLPEYHPARDMQDTFFIQTDPDILLRTHTSSVQVRFMENNQPPIRTISPGRVFRNEAISARSHCIFHQVEGLYIDKQVSFADLKQTLLYFTKALFGKSKIRLRPSYFPFTEPSAEVDIYWGLETETEIQIFQNALDFSEGKVREAMVPRTEIVAIENTADLSEIKKLFTSSGLSKIPVYDDSIDDILGYVHAFEMFKKPKSLKKILLPVVFIPETMKISEVLKLLTKQRKSIAVVLDEYGGTSGIITVEDIIEELFGEIEDEHDNVALHEHVIEEGVYEFSARLEVDYINQNYNLDLPENEFYETLGGMIVYYQEEIPSQGDVIAFENYTFEIKEVSSTKIEIVVLKTNPGH